MQITLTNVCKRFGDRPVLADVCASFPFVP